MKGTKSLTLAALMIGSSAVIADDVDSAYKLCGALDRTGLVTQCEVSGWGSSVDATIDTTGAEARKMCSQIQQMVGDQFSNNWKLQIFSPYSGDRPIAKCNL